MRYWHRTIRYSCNEIYRYSIHVWNKKEEWRFKNKEKIKEHDNKYYENNIEKIKNRIKKYSELKVELLKDKKKEYYEENKDEIKRKRKDYYINSKEQISEKIEKKINVFVVVKF